MKRISQALLSAMMVLSLAACSSSKPAASGVSGTFTGTAKGMGGDVTVTLTLENSVITNCTAEGEKETAGIGIPALETVADEIKTANSINVDTVSGATVTSSAIIEAASAALTSAGLNPEDYKTSAVASAAAAEDVTKDTDIVIVGAGGAGMTAAITAADAGSSVIVVESQAMVGGNSVRATGGMNAAATKAQQSNEFDETAGVEKTLASAAKNYADNTAITELAAAVQKQWDEYQANPTGYFDSVELMELDTMIGGKGINNPDLVKTLCENSADDITWLSTIGIDLTSVGSFGGASVKRIHRPVNAEGKTIAVGSYMVPILESVMKDKGIEVMLNTTANEILTDDNGAAVGIVAEKNDGSKVTINSKAVILATGGFGANNDMVKGQNPALDGYITTNAAGAQGQGIKMAEAVGAGTVDMKQIQLHPTVHVAEDGSANLITEGLRGDGAILVNKEGKRFTDEVGTRDVVSAAENEQTDGVAWLIVDQKMVDASAVIQGYITKGFTVTGTTVEELAAAMDVDSAALVASMDTWNANVKAGTDAEFGRTSFADPLDTAPYYAITVQPGVHHTMGGVTIDTASEVLNTSGTAVKGLFAAGEVTGGVHGANRLGGNAVCDFVVFGRIAGTSASEYVK